MKDFKFNDKFETKLGNVKERFIENLKRANRFTEEFCKRFNNESNFEQFVTGAFQWHLSNEAYEFKSADKAYTFWKNVSQR